MTLQKIISLVESGLYMQIETIMLIVFCITAIVFFAGNLKVGLLIEMFITGGLIIWFYNANLQWQKPLSAFFLVFVMLILSIYISSQQQRRGAIV